MDKICTEDKYSLFPHLFMAIFALILHLFFTAVFLFFIINSLKTTGAIKVTFNEKYILVFCVSDVIILFLYCYYLSYFWARAHITEEGLYWTLFGKTIKQVSWSEIADYLAFYPNNYRSPVIVFSKRTIEKHDLHRDLSHHWKKDEMFFLPYNKKVLNALPSQFRPEKPYHLYDLISSVPGGKNKQNKRQ